MTKRSCLVALLAGSSIACLCGANQSAAQTPTAPVPDRAAAQAQQARRPNVLYVVEDLGTLGGTFAGPSTINDRGWVVGGSTLASRQSGHATLWRDGAITDLGSLGGPNSIGLGVKDNRGLVAGVAETAAADPLAENFCGINAFYSIPATGLICRGFLWRDGLMTGLPTLGGVNSLANSANNRGETVGAAENSVHDPSCIAPQQFDYEAVVWGPGAGEIQTLPPLPGDKVSIAAANNASGLVTGLSGPCVSPGAFNSGTVPAHAVIWERGQATKLGTLGGTTGSLPTEINSKGEVAGASFLPGNAVFHGFLWRKGVMTDLGVLPGDLNSVGAGLNDQGQVVGGSFGLNGASSRPFLWENGVMTDLSTLIRPGSTSLTITFGNDINSRGEIAAEAFDADGHQRAVLLIPCNQQHADNKGCAGSAGATAAPAAFQPHPPWPVLPDQVRARLQQRFGFLRAGAR
jgi:probable HAF family extracellular repeat protein